MMNTQVLNILKDQCYENDKGELVRFTSAIDLSEASFISSLIQQAKPAKTIEIGCAEGGSSLTIMSSLPVNSRHTIVDPFQTTYWESKGLQLLRKFNYSNFNLVEKGSEIALPELLDKGEKFDFAFIDGYHTFDHTLLDAFYLVKMLNHGGILAIDDVQMPAINKCIRYLYNYPCLQYVASAPGAPVTGARKIFDGIKQTVNTVSKILPSKLRHELLEGAVLKSDKRLGLRSSMVAFRKIADDKREWNWWKPF
jgi:predicted O-methyltransferase YrrM